MKNRIKNWVIVLLVGVTGIALVIVYMMGTGLLMSHEAAETYALPADFQKIEVGASRAQVTVLPAEDAPRVTVYAKAWVSGPIDLSKRFSFHLEGETLTLSEIPFEAVFLGVFPQPYEMTITAYVPAAVYDSYLEGGA